MANAMEKWQGRNGTEFGNDHDDDDIYPERTGRREANRINRQDQGKVIKKLGQHIVPDSPPHNSGLEKKWQGKTNG